MKIFSVALLGILCVTAWSCKKDQKGEKIDMSGSVLDKKIDTLWQAPDKSMKASISVSASQGRDFYNTKTIYDVTVGYSITEGTFRPFTVKLKFRHFPQNYREYEASSMNSYPVTEESYSSYTFENPAIKFIGLYHFIPDPGPVDKIDITLK